MPTIRFLGRIIPSCVNCTITGVPEISWNDPERGATYRFLIAVGNSSVTVSCQFENGEEPSFTDAYIRSLDLAKAAVDTLAFSTGHGLSVILEHWVDSKGVSSEIMLGDQNLASLSTVYKRPGGFNDVLAVVLADHKIFHALNDLILSNTLPHHAVVNCARVVESVRELIAGEGVAPARGWPLMRQVLNVDQNYLQLITDTSTGPRHGHRTRVDGTTTSLILERTWVVMNRFLEYRIRGNQQLERTKFPMLSG
jgi:hypothetical protein